MPWHEHLHLLLQPSAASPHLANVSAFIHLPASNNVPGHRQGAGASGRGRTWARSLGKGDEPNLKLRHKAFSIRPQPWIQAHPLQPFPRQTRIPPPTSLRRHGAAVHKEHLSLSRAWEDAKRSPASHRDAPGRTGARRGISALQHPAWPPRILPIPVPRAPVRQRGWSRTLAMSEGDGGKIEQRQGGGGGQSRATGLKLRGN